jgi:hypothetical protein
MTPRVILLAALGLLFAGCFDGSDALDSRATVVKQRSVPMFAVAARAKEGTCLLTLPNGNMPPGGGDVGANHGNGKVWTTMWPHNVVIATPHYIEADGSVWMKWPWWWRRDVKGKLTITGRRLDAKAPPLTAHLPEGYDRGFQPSGISFPTEGCWEVTGAIGNARLTFVTLILKASRYWPMAEGG